ncbi:protein of unknown function [Paraburkholderia dioscoreae]|uniref:Uncharacterized protein n=1 Tax=Paraburkholderia dioscoreae TaxID=2604047 RepID=A0A5Q4YVE8_9BURK|nr:protein of unknown function [Paraburkholderia dioscoreae]
MQRLRASNSKSIRFVPTYFIRAHFIQCPKRWLTAPKAHAERVAHTNARNVTPIRVNADRLNRATFPRRRLYPLPGRCSCCLHRARHR